MTHVALLELTDWYRFRSVRLMLGPRAYAVEAEAEGDAARSNWQGKSALVEAIGYALYGWHRAQDEPERAAGYEDRWIRGRDGEPDKAAGGGVALTLSDGLRVERSRRRGARVQAETLLVRHAGGTAAGAEAQALIERAIGFGERDFFTAAYCRQKRCAQLVTERPAARMQLVADWLDFARLDRACELLGKRVTLAAAERDACLAKVATLGERLRELRAEEHFGLTLSTSPVEEAARAGELREERARLDLARAQSARERRAAWEVAEERRARARRTREQLAAAEVELAALPDPPTPPDVGVAGTRLRLAEDQLAERRRVARGEFDGRCPVAPGFQCPARAEINRGGAEAQSALADAQAGLLRARTEHGSAREGAAAADRLARDRARLEERVELLRQQAEPDPPAIPEPPAFTQGVVEQLRREHAGAVAELATFRRAAEEVARLEAKLAAESTRLPGLELAVAAARAARLALGRGGAQRRVAEGAVGEVAARANAALARGGVDLRVSLRWRDEGAELAATCEACGWAYPRGQAVKACGRCGAARGRVAHDRLTVLLSDRSGAAEDLAGLWLQRAAFEWLRERRGAPWSAMVLDEPFGALDEAHRRAVAAEVARMGRGSQLFVVAHQPGILEALPARILVRGRGGESTAEVIE